jgi:pyruvate,water dikinase
MMRHNEKRRLAQRLSWSVLPAGNRPTSSGTHPFLLSSNAAPPRQFDRQLAGGKGHYLAQLMEWGLDVPPFVVVTTAFFRAQEDDPGLWQELLTELHAELRTWDGAERFALRSSMSGEDGDENSFAGIMDSYLNVSRQELRERIGDCAASMTSARARTYHRHRSHTAEQVPAVVVQQMVRADRAGVAFSRAPTGNSALTYIEAGYGLGEGVVSGLIEVDGYWHDRFRRLIRQEIPRKEHQLVPAQGETATGTERIAVPDAWQDQPVLSNQELDRINRTLLQLEGQLGRPCDLEWCIDRDRLYVLQVRPITQDFPALRYYVDTNLSESYPGRTSPLTASFVQRGYAVIFERMARYLLLGGKVPDHLLAHYQTLIAHFHGHLYYNLKSYYGSLMALPGGKANIRNWHRMIGGQPVPDIDLDAYEGPKALASAKVVLSLLWTTLHHGTIFDRFCQEKEVQLSELYRDLDRASTPRACAELLLDSNSQVEGFELTTINDLLVMVAIGALVQMLQQGGYDESLLPDLIATNEVIDSLKPVQALEPLTQAIRTEPLTLELFARAQEKQGTDEPGAVYRRLFTQLSDEGFPSLAQQLETYLATYGDRSFGELKLECLTFNQSPRAFYKFLRWQTNKQSQSRRTVDRPPHRELDWKRFPRAMKPLVLATLSFARRTIAARERTRLIRGKYFGWFRAGTLKLGRLFLEQEPKDFGGTAVEDIFLLTLEDMQAYCDGAHADLLRQRMEERRGEERPGQYPEFLCHPDVPGGTIRPSFLEPSGTQPTQASTNSIELQGTGAAPGKARGRVLVLDDPYAALDTTELADRILVTTNTDPAWVFLMAECCGLVSEKGSLLSHSAIIGRELGLPTVVGVKGATTRLPDGALVELDGESGRVTILEAE